MPSRRRESVLSQGHDTARRSRRHNHLLLITLAFFSAVLPILILATIRARSVGVPFKLENIRPKNVVIDVTGREFVWHFRRADDGLASGTTSGPWLAGRLKLKPQTRVLFRVTSDDYIYVFEIPGVCREAAVPGLVHEVRFITSEPGTIDLPADPMCSFRPLHGDVMGTLIVENETGSP